MTFVCEVSLFLTGPAVDSTGARILMPTAGAPDQRGTKDFSYVPMEASLEPSTTKSFAAVSSSRRKQPGSLRLSRQESQRKKLLRSSACNPPSNRALVSRSQPPPWNPAGWIPERRKLVCGRTSCKRRLAGGGQPVRISRRAEASARQFPGTPAGNRLFRTSDKERLCTVLGHYYTCQRSSRDESLLHAGSEHECYSTGVAAVTRV